MKATRRKGKQGKDGLMTFNPLTPELNPSAQRCLTRCFYWGFYFFDRAFR
jgi:hypothetical protein